MLKKTSFYISTLILGIVLISVSLVFKEDLSKPLEGVMLGIAYLLILIDAPLWVTLAVVMVFLLYHVLGIYLMGKYQKEM